MPDPLPGFTYDKRIARYRVLTSGHGQRAGTLVARDKVLTVLREKIDESGDILQRLTTSFQNGDLTAQQWQVAFAEQLKTVHVQQAALGAGGWDRLTQRDYGRIGGFLKADYARLENFAKDIVDEKLTLPQAAARARLYAGKARAEFVATEMESQREAGKTEERRILGSAEHCSVCPDLAALGWTKLGEQPFPGGHPECWGACHCTMLYR